MFAVHRVVTKYACKPQVAPAMLACVNERLGSVRFAGGGGNPGGKPTFNWKERKSLGLRAKGEKHKVLRIKEFGDFTDIEEFIDTSKGDFLIDVSDMENFDFSSYGLGSPEDQAAIEARLAQAGNTRKLIQPSLLFGSSKMAGQIKKKYNYDRKTFVVGSGAGSERKKKSDVRV